MGVHTRITAPARRQQIETEVELLLNRATLLIARLDAMDGEPDLEDDDPAGDALDERGEAPTCDGTLMLTTPPLWGIDQTAGPINERDAHKRHQAAVQGLVRSPTGGWRQPAA